MAQLVSKPPGMRVVLNRVLWTCRGKWCHEHVRQQEDQLLLGGVDKLVSEPPGMSVGLNRLLKREKGPTVGVASAVRPSRSLCCCRCA